MNFAMNFVRNFKVWKIKCNLLWYTSNSHFLLMFTISEDEKVLLLYVAYIQCNVYMEQYFMYVMPMPYMNLYTLDTIAYEHRHTYTSIGACKSICGPIVTICGCQIAFNILNLPKQSKPEQKLSYFSFSNFFLYVRFVSL